MPSSSVTRLAFRTMPGPNVPFPPMEAELVRELPSGDGWQYEPKWDGFRGVLENDGGELALWSRKRDRKSGVQGGGVGAGARGPARRARSPDEGRGRRR